jgi:hypothetical protein
MDTLEGRRALVTGGSRGIGLGIVEALVARKARVMVVARDPARLAAVASRLGVTTIAGDVADPSFARTVLHDARPEVLVLNAGASPALGTIDQLTWEDFERPWQTDVKAGFHWVKASIALPLPRGSRVLLGSSGAAVKGSPISGGYAGAKRTLWLMADYANKAIAQRDLGIHFQALLPMQIMADTDLGRAAAEAYAKRQGISLEAFVAGFGEPLTPAKVGEHVVTLLTDPKYASGVAFGLKGGPGIVSLDG